ncbi:MAG: hypothetical protein BIFFINMI_03866 [Phycisphaerae bacterium]|nr:hypothetical protein [Phycisphaerae bacterium]
MADNQPIRRVVLVGHCGPDSYRLRYVVASALGSDVEVVTADDEKELEAVAGPESLLLINRRLDYGFETENGVELIHRLGTEASPPRMILVSNYPDAQEQAEAFGAWPGFGKAELGDDKAADAIKRAFAAAPDPTH